MRTLRLATFVLAALTISGAAVADDLSALTSALDWSGFYLGGHLGGGFGTSGANLARQQIATFIIRLSTDGAGLSAGTDTSGVLGGGQLGYNYQLGNFVIGAEADVSGADVTGRGGVP